MLMRNIEMNHIKIGEKEYPIYCDLYVLDLIQKKVGIYEFEHSLIGKEILYDENGDPEYDDDGIHLKYKSVVPSVEMIIYALGLFINEGILVESDQKGKLPIPIQEKEIIWALDIPFNDLVILLHNEFNRCFEVKKNSNQGNNTQKSRTLISILKGFISWPKQNLESRKNRSTE